MFCFPDVESRVLHERLKTTLLNSRHSSAHSWRWSWELRYLYIFRDFAYSWITEQPNLVRLLCRDANNTETVLFTMFFAFVLYGHKTEECNMTWAIPHEANRCTFSRSWNGVSWKRLSYPLLGTVGKRTNKARFYDFCTEVRKFHWKCHIYCFLFFFDRVYGEQKATL